MNNDSTVVATFSQSSASTSTLQAGAIFSTAQIASQSFLRFFNTGTTAGTVTATLRDSTTGQHLGQWTSPNIPAGAQVQYPIGTVEAGAGVSAARPSYYSLSVQSAFPGYFQHVLFRPSDGTLTNLSTCAAGVTADPANLSGVHSSIVGGLGYPSTVVVHNTGSTVLPLSLGIYNAATGSKIGAYENRTVLAPGGFTTLPVSQLEAVAGISASASVGHYVIRAEGSFTGFLQHLLFSQKSGVLTDMTTACRLDGLPVTPVSSPLRDSGGMIFSSAQASSHSFLRFFNTGTAAGTVTATLRDSLGRFKGLWTSAIIAPGSEQQFSISTVEAGAGLNSTTPTLYSLSLQAAFPGYFQHVLLRPTDGTLTNLSTCAAGVTADSTKLSGVHPSIVGALGYPSTVVINNTGNASASASLGIYSASTGAKLGSYLSSSIPANGQAHLIVNSIEAAAQITPFFGHYVVKLEGNFTGYLQHLVNNQLSGVVTDMTAACAMTVFEDDVFPDSTQTNGIATIGTDILRTINDGDADWFRLVATAGVTYAIEMRAASTGDGTLADPFIYLRDANGSALESAYHTGTENNALLSFKPTVSGTYFIDARAAGVESGTYRLRVSRGDVANGSDDYTPDNMATNGSIGVGQTVTGSLEGSGDYDWFRVTLAAGQAYIINLQGQGAGAGTLEDTYIEVRNNDGVVLDYNDDGPSNLDSRLTFTPSTTGIFYLVARGYSSEVGTYRLTIQ